MVTEGSPIPIKAPPVVFWQHKQVQHLCQLEASLSDDKEHTYVSGQNPGFL